MLDPGEKLSPADGVLRPPIVALPLVLALVLMLLLILDWQAVPVPEPLEQAILTALCLTLAWSSYHLQRTRQKLRAATQAQAKAATALFENQAQLRAFFNQPAAGVAIGQPDNSGALIFVNDRLCEMLGYAQQELLGQNWQTLAHPGEDLAETSRRIDAALAGDMSAYTMEKALLRADGQTLWVNLAVALIRDAANKPLCFFVLAVDISKRKRAEEATRAGVLALAQSEERYRLFFENVGVGAAEIGSDGHFARVNPKLCQISGYTAEELLAMTPLALSHPVGRPHDEATLTALLSGQSDVARSERRIVRKDGEIVWAQTVAKTIRDKAGGFERAVVIVEEINERKRAELSLRASERKYRQVVANAAIGFALTTLDGAIVDVNKALCQLVAYDLNELRSMNIQQLIHPDDRAVNRSEFERLAAREIPSLVIESRYLTKGGGAVWVRKSISIIRKSSGAAQWVVSLVEDITERRRAEADLRRLNLELETRVQTEVAIREATQARLADAEKLAALGQLAGGVAHDFNNILQAILSGASLLKRLAVQPEQVEKIAQMIEDSSLRGAAVTRRLLALARRDDLCAEPIDVGYLLADIRELLAQTLGDGIEVRVALGEDLPPALADRSQLETVLVNLANNGRDAMKGAGLLTIAAEMVKVAPGRPGGETAGVDLPPGAYIRFRVTDNGEGMDKATLRRATEPFFTTKERGKGTGLGLSMARGFAEQSGGALVVASEPGRGTEVTFWLPVASCEQEPWESPSAVDDAEAERRHRILLVDDEAIVRKVLADDLADQQHAIVQADSGVAALALLDAGETVDMLVTDFSMPGMDGVSLIQAARQRHPGLPALLLTGYAGEAAALAIKAAGCGPIALLRKPVSGTQLAERIAALLDSATKD
jgi:PAS domain S-box-containing protein